MATSSLLVPMAMALLMTSIMGFVRHDLHWKFFIPRFVAYYVLVGVLNHAYLPSDVLGWDIAAVCLFLNGLIFVAYIVRSQYERRS